VRLALVMAVPVVLAFVVLAMAKEPPKPPMFIRWLKADDPGDQTIRAYWQRVEAGGATPEDMVDLGSMLYLRGYPKDAIRMFRRALDEDEKLYEAWFRIGLVEHREGNLRAARRAYRKCLKELTGHGWCNFYMGLLQEQLGHPSRALDYYRRAFKFAPALADPEVNPELLYSRLQLGAVLRHNARERFTTNMPMDFLRPERVAAVEARFGADPEEGEADPEGREATPARTAGPHARPVPTPGQGSTQGSPSGGDRQGRRGPARVAPRGTSAPGSDEPASPAVSPVSPESPESQRRIPAKTEAAEGGRGGQVRSSGSSHSSTSGSSSYDPPYVGSTSSEARLLPWWPTRAERMALELAGRDAARPRGRPSAAEAQTLLRR
jgi:hypothetical protein